MYDFQQIRQLVGTLRSAQNPGALMQNMIQRQNPQLAQALAYIRQHGNDPRAAFEALAKEKGASPEELAELMR